jgi:hypothetical protein
MRGLLSSFDFTIPAFVAVAMTTLFAFVLEAPLEPVVSMLGFGVIAAFIEYRARSKSTPPR